MSDAPRHWREFLDSEVVRFVDLKRDYAVQISRVEKGKVNGAGGRSSTKAMIHLTGWPKPIAAGTSILSVIAGMYSNDTTRWKGEWIQIFPDPNVTWAGAKVGGVRVRPTPPPEDQRKLPTLKETK